MKTYTFALLICFLSVFSLNAQITNTLQFSKAKRLISIDAYHEALPIIDSLSQKQNDNYNLQFLLGLCYYHHPYQQENAIPYFEKAAKHVGENYKNQYKESKAPAAVYYYLAHAYLLDYRIDDCIKLIEAHKSEIKNQILKQKAEQLLTHAQNAKVLMLDPIKIEIEQLSKAINSEHDDYTPLINADESVMVFTSRRQGTGALTNDEGKYYEDVYISQKENGHWSTAQNMGIKLNTKRHDACVALSADGNHLIIYRDDYGIGNLYLSNKDSLGWSEATKMSSNINSKYNETHAAFSHDGQSLFFVSDIKDGFGGKDIYCSKKLPDGTWSYPQNLGENINTAGHEDGVYIHPDGQKLYFSSTGHNSMGGYDLFYCDKLNDSTWSAPINMGYPINTTNDDIFAVFSADGKRAYYSANKKDGSGGFDIYMMNLMSLPERNNTIIKGHIKDQEGNIVLNKSLKINDKKGLLVGRYKPNKAGLYTIVLQQGQEYQLKCTGLELESSSFAVPKSSAFYITQKALEMGTIAKTK